MRAPFEIGVREGLLDPRHVRAMRQAVWLFLWYVRRQTPLKVEGKTGWVAGGTELRWSIIEQALGVPRATLQKWQQRLKGENPEGIVYVEEIPGRRGFRIRLVKQRKFKAGGDPCL